MGAELVLGREGALDARDDLRGRRIAQVHFHRDAESLLAPALAVAVAVERKCGPASSAQGRVAGFDGSLDVLGIVVLAAEDDQILEPARDEELAGEEEAHVARAQEGPFVGIGQVRTERLQGGLDSIPVAARHARARDPHFAHRAFGARPS